MTPPTDREVRTGKILVENGGGQFSGPELTEEERYYCAVVGLRSLARHRIYDAGLAEAAIPYWAGYDARTGRTGGAEVAERLRRNAAQNRKAAEDLLARAKDLSDYAAERGWVTRAPTLAGR